MLAMRAGALLDLARVLRLAGRGAEAGPLAGLARDEGRRSEATPAPLRRDVGLLGRLLGQVLEEAGGPELLADVERLRRATIELRAADGHRRQARARVVELVASFDLDRAELLAQAFTVYFQLVNLAEEQHRVRTLRERHLAGGPVRESFAAAVQEVTEAAGTDGRAAQLRRDRPSPLDEVRSVMAVFDATLFRLVPATYRALEQALRGEASGTGPPPFPAYLRWGSWVGGDRDGNPSVTAETTRAAMAIQADHVLRGLEAVARRVGHALTVAGGSTPPAPELAASLARDRAGFRHRHPLAGRALPREAAAGGRAAGRHPGRPPGGGYRPGG